MLNPLNFISKFIKSSNQKELDRLKKIVEQKEQETKDILMFRFLEELFFMKEKLLK